MLLSVGGQCGHLIFLQPEGQYIYSSKAYLGSAVEKAAGTETLPLANDLAGEVTCGRKGNVDGC
jgi:hypothetical protein